jgi:acetyl-CoA carboxylase beta subunit
MLSHGLVDAIVKRKFLRERIVQLLGYMMPE